MKKILVVDDDKVQRDLYVDVFRSEGYDVVFGVDGLEGLDLALKEKPDLVFTGIMMPKMDGFELIKKIRDNADASKLPIIMFSHLGRKEDRERANALSNVTFMVKGEDGPVDILKKIKELLDL